MKFIKRFIQINKNTNIVCDYISVELSLKILSIWNNYFRSIIEFHNNVTYSNNILLFSYKFVLLNSTISEMDKNKSDMSDDFKKDAQNDEVKSIVLGLFALIGFIIIIYSIFMGVVGEPLASVADTVFVAAIIGSFTLVGTIVGRGLLKK